MHCTDRYRVAVFSSVAGQWVLTDRTFESASEANDYLEQLADPFKRIVRVPDRATAAVETVHPALDRKRLEFARYLLRTGLIGP